MRQLHRLVLLASVLALCTGPVRAQTATLSGFVTDADDGHALEGAAVALFALADANTLAFGVATNPEGLYLISRIEPGAYRVQISFVGYRTVVDTLDLVGGVVHSATVTLAQDPAAMDEVIVVSERTTGAARITAGAQRIRPEDIEQVPSPDLSADLVNYLTTLPGIVTTGDRGGQFFVRGGEPPQNLVLVDDIIVYQPFHVLGFYSALPAEIVERADVYAGGFGSKYTGRLSSVIDVATRGGNNRRLAGMVSGSPFTGALRLEGPIVPGEASFLLSGRHSLVNRTGPSLYDEPMPFLFSDAFGKLRYTPGGRHRFSVTNFHTYDRGELATEITEAKAQQVRWTNDGFSISWLALSKNLPIATELTYSRSRHEMQQGVPDSTLRSSKIWNSRLALHATFSESSFFRGRSATVAGWDVVFARTRNALAGLFQNISNSGTPIPEFGLFVEPTFTYPGGWMISSGLRMEWYNVRITPFLEPRLRIEWHRSIHHISGALGFYRQQVIGLSDRRDPTSIFTAWTGIPRDDSAVDALILNSVLRDRIGRAMHMLLGYRMTPSTGFEAAVEGFYKLYSNLLVAEWTAFPQLTTRMQPAEGRSVGLEVRMEARRGPLYGFVTYGLSYTRYTAVAMAIPVWYGEERLTYRPPHDRRHNVNALLSLQLYGFDMSVRWQLGSGLPYTRPLAFDGFALVDDIRPASDLEHSRRVVYDRPYDSTLPAYHRLDASVERTWHASGAAITVQASAINLYDRRNIFFVDLFTLQRQDQLPFVPSLGLRVAFD